MFTIELTDSPFSKAYTARVRDQPTAEHTIAHGFAVCRLPFSLNAPSTLVQEGENSGTLQSEYDEVFVAKSASV